MVSKIRFAAAVQYNNVQSYQNHNQWVDLDIELQINSLLVKLLYPPQCSINNIYV